MTMIKAKAKSAKRRRAQEQLERIKQSSDRIEKSVLVITRCKTMPDMPALPKTETQKLRFVFMPRMSKGEQKPHFFLSSIGHAWNALIKRAGIRRRNPYHTRHTYACWLLSAGANPAFIASQMGHDNAQMVFEVYGAWMTEMNNDQISMLNDKLAI